MPPTLEACLAFLPFLIHCEPQKNARDPGDRQPLRGPAESFLIPSAVWYVATDTVSPSAGSKIPPKPEPGTHCTLL